MNEFDSKTIIHIQLKQFHLISLYAVDGSQAGSGNLEILVNGGRVTSSVRALGMQKFVASFTPHESGTHTVQITFNGETVPGAYHFFYLFIVSNQRQQQFKRDHR